MKKTLIFLSLLLVSLGSLFAIGNPTGAVLTVTNTGSLTETTQENVTAQGGNVSNMMLESNFSTNRWQGFVGNVSGNVSLGRAANTMYNFGEADVDTVFATTNNAFSWSALEPAAAADVDTVWGFTTATNPDTANNTFTGSNVVDTAVAAVPTAATYNSTGAGVFLTGLYDDGATAAKGNFAFGARVYTAQNGFDGQTYEYQLMVPTPVGSTDVYWIYASLNE